MEQFLNSSEWNSGVKQVRGHMVHMYARKLTAPVNNPERIHFPILSLPGLFHSSYC